MTTDVAGVDTSKYAPFLDLLRADNPEVRAAVYEDVQDMACGDAVTELTTLTRRRYPRAGGVVVERDGYVLYVLGPHGDVMVASPDLGYAGATVVNLHGADFDAGNGHNGDVSDDDGHLMVGVVEFADQDE
jgi:hypothetical protein